MTAESKGKGKDTKKRKRIWRWLVAGLVVLILAVIFGVPVLLSSGFGRRMITTKISSAVAGRAELGRFSMSWWRGIIIKDFRFEDDNGMMKVAADGISTKPDYVSLLGGSVSLGQTRIDRPRVEIDLGKEAVGRLDKSRNVVYAGVGGGRGGLGIKRIDLVVNDGSFKVTDKQAKTSEIGEINSHVKLRAPGKATYASASMSVLGNSEAGKIKVDGNVVPEKKKGWTLDNANGKFSADVNGLDLESLGALFALAGVEIDAKGTISGKLESTIKQGKLSDVKSTLKGQGVEVGGPGLDTDRLKMPHLDVNIELQRQGELMRADRFEADGTWIWCELRGVIPTTFEALEGFVKADSPYNLKGSFGCDVAAAAAQVPHALGLKEGMKVTSGKLEGKIDTVTEGGHKSLLSSVSLSELGGVVEGKQIGLSEPVEAVVQVTSEDGVLKFDKLDVSSSFMKLTGTGTAELLTYEAKADLVKLQSELGQFIDMKGYEVSGSAWEKGKISKIEDKITVVGTSGITELRVNSPNGVSAYEPKAAIDFSLVAEPNRGILSIDLLKIAAGLGEISITDSVVAISDKSEEGTRLGVSVKQLDLGKLGQFGKVFGQLPSEAELGGLAEATVLVSSKRDKFALVTDTARVKGLKVTWPEKKPFEQEDVLVILDVKGDTTEKTISVKKLRLISPHIKIEGQMEQRFENGKKKLSGEANMEYDWKALTGMLGAYLPSGLELAGMRKDSVSFSSEYSDKEGDSLAENLNTKAAVGFDNGSYMGLNFGLTEVAVEIAQGLLEVKPFSAEVNNGRLNFGARANLREKPALLKTTAPLQIVDNVQITDEMGTKLFSVLNPIFGDMAGISGIVDFNCTELSIPLGGEAAENLVVEGTVSMENVRVQGAGLIVSLSKLFGKSGVGQDFTIHPTDFSVRDGVVRYNDMQIDAGDDPFNFGGRIGIVDKLVDMTVTVPWTIEGETIRAGSSRMDERVSLPLTGTTDKIRIDTSKLLESQLRNRLEKEIGDTIRRGIGDIFK